MSLDRLLDEISRDHFPQPPASVTEIEAFERTMGWRLDPDLRAFYLRFNGAELFWRPDSPYRFRPLSQIRRARVDMRGEDSDNWGPASWYVICDLYHSDRIIVDVGTVLYDRYPILDGFHEASLGPEECPRIADSFADFLKDVLCSGGRKFWLGPPDI